MLNDASDTKNFIARYFYVFQHMAWFHFWALMDLSGPGTFQTLKENKSFESFWIIISFNLENAFTMINVINKRSELNFYKQNRKKN